MINEAGLECIKEFESISLSVYRDCIGIPTIGYGATYDLDGERVTMDHEEITAETAIELLQRDCNISFRSVERLTQPYFDDLTENQKGALTSLTFNIGSGNFRASQVRSLIKQGCIEDAGNQFWQWRRAGGIILKGLVRRREAETALFFS